jgi:lipoprotein-anchoring transpeptidase ErfK/SrfK
MADKAPGRNASPLPLLAISAVIVVFAFLLITRGSGEDEPAPPLAIATTEATATAGPPTETPTPAPNSSEAPTAGRWIDVDVTRLEVQLMEGNRVIRTIGPVAVGEQVDTGEYESTQTGLFYVHVKTPDLTYDAPYDTYISHWVGFDPDKDNGFHSLLKDAGGNVVDASTGRVSNGCIRSGDVEAIFEFAEIGMPVLVHA